MSARSSQPKPSAADFLPLQHDLKHLAKAAEDCQGCALYERATQTVFGEGAAGSPLFMIGEQPGDQEDLQGRPFVGPAGKLLDEVLGEAGIDRKLVYVTNAVKHFKWEPRGKRRLHAKPTAREMAACRPWLEAEIEAVSPRLIVCLGATAAQSLMGSSFRITQHRGELLEFDRAERLLATYHPSAVLRAPDHDAREAMRQDLVNDLKNANTYLSSR
jgi:DNA polymerase